MARNKKLQDFTRSIDIKSITEERKKELNPFADYIQSKVNENKLIYYRKSQMYTFLISNVHFLSA